MRHFTKFRGLLFASMITAIFLLTAGIVKAQVSPTVPSAKPFSNAYETYSQMWNVSNTYFGTVLPVSKPTNLGVQLDTGAAGATIYLGAASFIPGIVQTDSFYYSPIGGYGPVEFTAKIYRAGASTAVVVPVLESSSDGTANSWGTVPGWVADTVSATSLTVAVVRKYSVTLKQDRYYRLKFIGDASHAYSAQATFYFQRPYQLTN